MTFDFDQPCHTCAPLGCDCSDTERPPLDRDEYRTPGCRCGADLDGRDCMCFE